MVNTQARQTDGSPATLFDEDGFIKEPSAWSKSLAEQLARNDGLPDLSKAHWDVISSLRAHYFNFGEAPPAFRHVCFINHLGKYCLDELFTSRREAWRIAGLPNPGEEAKSYL